MNEITINQLGSRALTAEEIISAIELVTAVSAAQDVGPQLDKLIDRIRELSGFDIAMISSIYTDGVKAFQKAGYVTQETGLQVSINRGDVWPWEEGACSKTAYTSSHYVEDFADCFPDTFWATVNLQGFVSVPITAPSGRVAGTLILGDFHGRVLPSGLLQVLYLAASAIEKSVNCGSSPLQQTRSWELNNELIELHGLAINSLSASRGWLEQVQELEHENSSTGHLLGKAMERIQMLRLQINEMLAISTNQNI